MYEDKTASKSKKVIVNVTGLLTLVASSFISAYFGMDATFTQELITALVLGHTATQGGIDWRMVGKSVGQKLIDVATPVIVEEIASSQIVNPPYPLPVPQDTPAVVPAPAVASSKSATPDQVTS